MYVPPSVTCSATRGGSIEISMLFPRHYMPYFDCFSALVRANAAELEAAARADIPGFTMDVACRRERLSRWLGSVVRIHMQVPGVRAEPNGGTFRTRMKDSPAHDKRSFVRSAVTRDGGALRNYEVSVPTSILSDIDEQPLLAKALAAADAVVTASNDISRVGILPLPVRPGEQKVAFGTLFFSSGEREPIIDDREGLTSARRDLLYFGARTSFSLPVPALIVDRPAVERLSRVLSRTRALNIPLFERNWFTGDSSLLAHIDRFVQQLPAIDETKPAILVGRTIGSLHEVYVAAIDAVGQTRASTAYSLPWSELP
jgi:hypothetical protein